jgi:hypothetical protein
MSYGLYIGRNLTSDRHAWLGGYGDEPSSHWLEIIAAQEHSACSNVTVGVTPSAMMPGILSDIPQVKRTARQLRVSYSHYRGVPAPITNGGLNEYGVAVRDIWSPSRAELVAMTPHDQKGPNYSDLAKLVLDRARNAREGVELIGALIRDYGYSCYGGNSHIIADADEAYVMIEFSGGLGLWVAERLHADSIRASRPGYIGIIPKEPDQNFLFPPHFITTAIEHGWYQTSDGPFDVNKVYGDGNGPSDSVRWIEGEMQKRAARAGKITFEDIVWAISTERLTGDTAGYGQIVPLETPNDDRLRYLWHCPVGPVAAPFVPVFLGSDTIPVEYGPHRYLTEGEAARFHDLRKAIAQPDSLSLISQSREISRSAFQIYKALLHVVFMDHETLLPLVSSLFRETEKRVAEELKERMTAAKILFDGGRADLATQLLTEFSTHHLIKNLNTAEYWLRALEARHRIINPTDLDKPYYGPRQIW